jgi:hypothetical protein
MRRWAARSKRPTAAASHPKQRQRNSLLACGSSDHAIYEVTRGHGRARAAGGGCGSAASEARQRRAAQRRPRRPEGTAHARTAATAAWRSFLTPAPVRGFSGEAARAWPPPAGPRKAGAARGGPKKSRGLRRCRAPAWQRRARGAARQLRRRPRARKRACSQLRLHRRRARLGPDLDVCDFPDVYLVWRRAAALAALVAVRRSGRHERAVGAERKACDARGV